MGSAGRRLLAILVAVLLAAPAAGAAEPAGTGRVAGAVTGPDGEPLAGVRVILTPQGSDRPAREARTDARGRYELAGLAHGYYRCVLLREGQAYPGNRVLLIPPGKKVRANWQLGPLTPRDRMLGLAEGQPVPEVGGAAAVGVAHLEEKLGPTGIRWLTTGKGALVLLGGTTALIAGLIALSGNEEPIASPSSP